MSATSIPFRPESQAAVSPINQIVAIFESNHWDWDDERAMQGMADLDDAGQALLGRLYRHWAMHDEGALAGPLGTLTDIVYEYARSGDDPEIAARCRDAIDEKLHPEACYRMANQDADVFREAGDFEMAAKAMRDWGVEPTPEDLQRIGGVA